MLCANSSRSSKRCAKDRAVAIGQELANSEENMSYHQRLRAICVFLLQCCWHGWACAGCHMLPLMCCTSFKKMSAFSLYVWQSQLANDQLIGFEIPPPSNKIYIYSLPQLLLFKYGYSCQLYWLSNLSGVYSIPP